jgi:2-polyprenyl-3-methyl-5-hydroxy-6-metoxy-1,4-benzoquinol methylase
MRIEDNSAGSFWHVMQLVTKGKRFQRITIEEVPFTGERVIPGKTNKPCYFEHLARYLFASIFTKQKKVLDLGCGVGYGSYLLKESGANEVIGVDIADEAIGIAKGYYKLPGIEFLFMDARSLGFQDESFDVVVAFELIEHLIEQDEVLSETRRVLKDEGILIISTPNKAKFPSDFLSPFHLKELNFAEFSDLLRHHFSYTAIFGEKFPRWDSPCFSLEPLEGLYLVGICSKKAFPFCLTSFKLSREELELAYQTILKPLPIIWG